MALERLSPSRTNPSSVSGFFHIISVPKETLSFTVGQEFCTGIATFGIPNTALSPNVTPKNNSATSEEMLPEQKRRRWEMLTNRINRKKVTFEAERQLLR